MDKIKVLIVDDQYIIREGLKLTLLITKDIAVTGEASNGLEAINLIRKNDYDVVVMDVNMPEMNGIESTKIIKSIKPNIKVLINSMLNEPENITKVLQAGASGYVDKSQPFEYEEAIRTVSNGGVFLSEDTGESIYNKVFSYLKSPSNTAVFA